MNRRYYVLKGALVAGALCVSMYATSWDEQAYRTGQSHSPYTAAVTVQAAIQQGGLRLAQYAHAFLSKFH